jgi:hypothetical protein
MTNARTISGPVVLALLALGAVACSGESGPDGSSDVGAAGNGGQAGAVALLDAGGGGAGAAGGAGGSRATGGATAAGGSSGTGGATGAGGSTGTGGSSGTGGATGAGGSTGTGGVSILSDGGNCPGRPALTPGVFKDITVPGLGLVCCPGYGGNSYGWNDIQFDPENPCILYALADQSGMYKSTDAGATWTKLGTGSPSSGTSTTILDSPLHMRVDPHDSEHLYAVQGVRGVTQGFWISRDGGMTWTMPAAFDSGSSLWMKDVYSVNVEPGNFNHVLLGFHAYQWSNNTNGDTGVLESKDGGTTWISHYQAGFSHGNVASFLDNAQTWLLGTQDHGYFRTSDGGTSWTQVSTTGMTHGGTQLYRSRVNGALYTGAWNGILRSTDDGVSWANVTSGVPYSAYYTVFGDGRHLYAQDGTTGAINQNQPYITSAESDGLVWAPYNGGAQKFINGPYNMTYDEANGILYSANWAAGLFALKVLP